MQKSRRGRTFTRGVRILRRPFAETGFTGDADLEGSVRARLNAGVDLADPDGWYFELLGFSDGLDADDFEAYCGRGRIAKRF